MKLSPYNFTISYRPGKDNGVPDALSRNPFFQADNLELPFLLYSIDKDDKAPEINAKQSKDVFCKKLADLIKAKQTEKFFYDNHLTLKRRTIINGIERHQIVLPQSEIFQIMKLYHNESGHFGINRTCRRLSLHYYWPGMLKHIKNFVNKCDGCQRVKVDRKKCFGFYSIFKTSQPWERVGLDFVGPLPRSKNGHEYILFCCDYLTKFVVSSSSDMTAKNCYPIL